ncbi:unnamed protein product [Sphagnum jensenii]|uniref:Uncharacterized protein n=1 Tax=Sphagnum jensenii TaxID=128206 RepID=A0ABP0WY86_9BRYO
MEAMAMHVWVVMVDTVVEDMEAVAMVQAMEVVEDTAVAAMADIILTAGASFLFQWYVTRIGAAPALGCCHRQAASSPKHEEKKWQAGPYEDVKAHQEEM